MLNEGLRARDPSFPVSLPKYPLWEAKNYEYHYKNTVWNIFPFLYWTSVSAAQNCVMGICFMCLSIPAKSPEAVHLVIRLWIEFLNGKVFANFGGPPHISMVPQDCHGRGPHISMGSQDCHDRDPHISRPHKIARVGWPPQISERWWSTSASQVWHEEKM